MPEDPRPPVAVRISRPQANEDEFLQQELDTVTRTGVTLLGAQPRPQGVVLRFEIVLASGIIVMRGEGRVVAFKPNAHQNLGGLTLRFTRLDSKSKALVDRANALRDSRRPSLYPSSPAPPPAADLSPGPPVAADSAPSIPSLPSLPSMPSLQSLPDTSPASVSPRSRPSAPPAAARPPASRPPYPALPTEGREAILDRLRERVKRFDAKTIESILAQKPRP